ncbi:hypothetical protein [Hymenobacter psychrophilus]|uniref:GLPGLI family protein n=1 Tax=Hymenobacter psychrophilus TaxID=651662 RepID=A0A1H3J0Q6_9BACT|nr:hypothetical protein [Hymenobacter psychrophilus]SDY33175.1 hypothetical protein SAMN04488069_107223 [Hymenobacter psychrophilus]
MIRFLVLFVALLLPQALFAQFGSYESGTYVLVDNRQVRYSAKLKLRDENTLLIKEGNSKKEKIDLEEVLWFQVANRKFVPIGGFHVKKGLGGTDVQRGFAEVLDSGQVKLYEYSYYVSNPPRTGSGGMVYGGGASWTSVHLLQRPGEQEFTVVTANRLSGAGKNFREILTPFITARPDLQKLLADRKISIENLAPFVRALNSGEPYKAPILPASQLY